MDEETLRRIMREELLAYDLRRRTAPELSEKRRAAAAERWRIRDDALALQTKPKRTPRKTTDKDASALQSDPELSPGSKAFARYASAYKLRYGAWPVRNAKVNALLTQLVKRLGVEAPDVAEAYVGFEEPLYVRSGHAVELLVRDCEKIRTTWATGRVAAGNGSGKPWWEVWSGIEAQGDELGIDREPDNPQAYKHTVYRAAHAAGRLPDDVARKVGVA